MPGVGRGPLLDVAARIRPVWRLRVAMLAAMAVLGNACSAAGDTTTTNQPVATAPATTEATAVPTTTATTVTTTTWPEPPDGAALYAQHCAACHGEEGEGGIGPVLGDGVTVAVFPDIEDEITIVTDGVPPLMAAYGELNILTAEEIRAIVVYGREVLGR